MKRIEKIYQYVKEQTKNLTPMTLTSDAGVTTQEISERLNIQRTNASKDLNQLVREGRLKKLSGRPVKYVAQVAFQHRPSQSSDFISAKRLELFNYWTNRFWENLFCSCHVSICEAEPNCGQRKRVCGV